MQNIEFDKRKRSFLLKLTQRFSSTQIIALGFLFFIITGTLLLMLPISHNHSTSLLDALFTSTSAVCVTGLTVVTTASHWTGFGKLVILILIQVGGLGAMTFATIVLMLLNKKINFRQRLIIQESLNQDSLSGIIRMVKRIVFSTFIVEAIGAIFLSFRFIPEYGPIKGIWYSVFHSISAFCNAGFDIVGDSSLIPYVDSLLINSVITILIIMGGLGFSVWFDIISTIKNCTSNFNCRFRKNKNKDVFKKFSLQTKLVLLSTIILIVVGTLLIFVFEFENPKTFGSLSLKGKLLASFFQSVAPRTAGFATLNLSDMTYASQFLYIILMFIGGSPGGTAGGMKTVTLTVIIITVISVIKGKENISVFKRKISFLYLQKSLAIVMMGLTIIAVSTVMLTFTENSTTASHEFIDVLFESTSAIGTVGSTLSFTTSLSQIGRVIICLLMYIGRLGPLTVAMALTEKSNKSVNKINYPDENILVG